MPPGAGLDKELGYAIDLSFINRSSRMIVGSHSLGDLALAGGGMLPDARISFGLQGRLAGDRRNCVLLPTYFGGTHASYAPLIGRGKALDPDRWFIIAADMFGNGQSTSPSNWSGSGEFPLVHISDNVAAQARLLEERFDIRDVALVGGWSMGAMQALCWGVRRPSQVRRIAAWCGTARCWPLNYVFLEGMRAALLADPSVGCIAGRRAFGRAYAGWAYSAVFYRDELWRGLGFDTLEAFLLFWEEDHLCWDGRDLLAMLRTWQHADPAPAGETLQAALARVTAKVLIMPCDEDAYFTPEEARQEARLIADASFRLLHSSYGHCAGAPGRFASETAAIDDALADLLN